MIPLAIASRVFVPKSGKSSSGSMDTSGNFLVSLCKALIRILMPGVIFPPIYSPVCARKSMVMAVPTSMMRQSLSGRIVCVAMAAESRSSPNVSGVL